MKPPTITDPDCISPSVLHYYEAIEKASAEMLDAARAGDWNQVVKLEGACVLLISQLKQAAREAPLQADEAKLKSRIMQRILLNDAEIRHLAEPWLGDLDLSHQDDGTTVLRGPVADQAALHGLLRKVRDLGVPLVSVTRTDAQQLSRKRPAPIPTQRPAPLN